MHWVMIHLLFWLPQQLCEVTLNHGMVYSSKADRKPISKEPKEFAGLNKTGFTPPLEKRADFRF